MDLSSLCGGRSDTFLLDIFGDSRKATHAAHIYKFDRWSILSSAVESISPHSSHSATSNSSQPLIMWVWSSDGNELLDGLEVFFGQSAEEADQQVRHLEGSVGPLGFDPSPVILVFLPETF